MKREGVQGRWDTPNGFRTSTGIREREREMRGNWWNGRVWIVPHSIGRDVLDSRSLALGSNSPFQCDPWSGFGLGLGPCVIRDSIRQKGSPDSICRVAEEIWVNDVHSAKMRRKLIRGPENEPSLKRLASDRSRWSDRRCLRQGRRPQLVA